MENKEKVIEVDKQLNKTKEKLENEKKQLMDMLESAKSEDVDLDCQIAYFENLLNKLEHAHEKGGD